jgi:hypothetical protein
LYRFLIGKRIGIRANGQKWRIGILECAAFATHESDGQNGEKRSSLHLKTTVTNL